MSWIKPTETEDQDPRLHRTKRSATDSCDYRNTRSWRSIPLLNRLPLGLRAAEKYPRRERAVARTDGSVTAPYPVYDTGIRR